MLALKSLTVLRQEQPLFAPITINMVPGELWQISGPNGRGKTSLLKVLLGLSQEYTGTFKWDSSIQAGTPVHLSAYSGLFYIGHKTGLHPQMTLLDNMQQLFALYGLSLDTLDTILLQLGLMGYEHLQCSKLSAGQSRKITLAPLLHQDIRQRVWLFDEPFTSIDQATCIWLESLILQHVQTKGLVLLSSHQPFATAALQSQVQKLELELPIPNSNNEDWSHAI